MGITFAGDGGKDTSINKTSTSPGEAKSAGKGPIDMAGNGNMDTSKVHNTIHGSQGIGSRPIDMAGNGNMDKK